jgi:hypothetical protein
MILIALIGGMAMNSAHGEERDGFDFFESRIRPLLVERCYECHSANSEKIRGGLKLDSREAVLKGGDSGRAIVPGDVEKSLLIKAVRYSDKELKMPPKASAFAAGNRASRTMGEDGRARSAHECSHSWERRRPAGHR